jgi:YggT family protein
MKMGLFVVIIQVLSQVITLLVFVHVILSFVMSPYHPVRQAVDRVIEPLLSPIRRLLPQMGMFDFSPLVLIILVQIVSSILLNLLVGR